MRQARPMIARSARWPKPSFALIAHLRCRQPLLGMLEHTFGGVQHLEDMEDPPSMDDYFDNRDYLDFLLKYCDAVEDDALERVPGAKLIIEHLTTLDLKPEMRVLEVGCGTGRVLEIMKAAFGVTADGCDISSYAIEHLKEQRPAFAERVRTLDSHGLEIYPNETYDAVVYWGVFELTPQRAHIAELSRLLKTGGEVFLSSIKHINPFPDDEAAQAALAAYKEKQIPIYLTDPEPFETMAAAFGFEVARRVVFERKNDLVNNKYDVDNGGPRTFSEAFYVLKKTKKMMASASFNQTFGVRAIKD